MCVCLNLGFLPEKVLSIQKVFAISHISMNYYLLFQCDALKESMLASIVSVSRFKSVQLFINQCQCLNVSSLCLKVFMKLLFIMNSIIMTFFMYSVILFYSFIYMFIFISLPRLQMVVKVEL